MGTLWVHPSVRSRFRFPGFKIQDLFTHKQGPSVAILRMVLHYFERLSIQSMHRIRRTHTPHAHTAHAELTGGVL
jgi:hypothetical protein